MGAWSSKSLAEEGVEGQEGENGNARFLCRQARGRVENKLKGLGGYLPLYRAVVKGEWNEARKFMDEEREALMAKITVASERPLHIAVGTGDHLEFLEKLVRRMSPEDVALTDQNGETALSVAAAVGNVRVAKLLVSKNPDLPNMCGKSGFPIHRASQYGHIDMIQYLMDITRDDIESSPFAGKYGGQLLINVINADFYDIALELVERYPEMATTEVLDVGSPLSVLARKTTAFPSGGGAVSHWLMQLLYDYHVYFSGDVRKRKKKQHDALELVKSLCAEILELDDAKAFSLLQQPLLIAAKLGIHEIIEEIVDVFPPAIWASDEENHNVFQLAVLHRRENVFNLIHQMSNYKILITGYVDSSEHNNILHLAGKLPSLDRLNHIKGVALQVQCELEWFKEVEKYVRPDQKQAMNKAGKTPEMVFREEHKELMKDGEKWVKATARSCTVAATLIATVAFNAGLHVPGGDNNDGRSHFYHRVAFSVFSVTDAISLFSSIASILEFLMVLVSSYSEEDFRVVIPKRLHFGMLMLLISIVNMIIAFSSAIYLAFGPLRATVVVSVGSLLIMPYTLQLLWLLLPTLLRRTFESTFLTIIGTQGVVQKILQTIFRSKSIIRPGIFGKQSDRKLH